MFYYFSMMTTISFNSVPASDPFSIPGSNKDRIKTVLESIENYGVDKKFLFSVEDLHDAQHIPRVVRCLEQIEKLVCYFRKGLMQKKVSKLGRKSYLAKSCLNWPKLEFFF